MIELYAHQSEALMVSRDATAFALLMEAGTGKSLVTIETIKHQFTAGKIDAALIFAPQTVVRGWAVDHLPKFLDVPDTKIVVGHVHGAKYREEAFAEALRHPGLVLWVVNYDYSISPTGKRAIRRFLDKRKAMMVLDESTRIRTPGAARTKSLTAFGRHAVARRILTGTPLPKNPFNFFTQFRFLDPAIIGVETYAEFKTLYGVWEKGYNRATKTEYPILAGYRNMDQLVTKVAPFSFRARKEECLSLPPKIYQQRYVKLPPERMRLYRSVRDVVLEELRAHNLSLPNVIVRLIRLQGMVCGIYPDVGEDPKLSAILEEIEESEGKIIVWTRFRDSVKRIANYLRDAGYPTGELMGGSDLSVLDRFTDPSNPTRILVGVAAVGGVGLNLQVADTVIYHANTYNYEERSQSEDRAHRAGQTKPVRIVDITCEGTIDEHILKSIHEKKDLETTILRDIEAFRRSLKHETEDSSP